MNRWCTVWLCRVYILCSLYMNIKVPGYYAGGCYSWHKFYFGILWCDCFLFHSFWLRIWCHWNPGHNIKLMATFFIVLMGVDTSSQFCELWCLIGDCSLMHLLQKQVHTHWSALDQIQIHSPHTHWDQIPGLYRTEDDWKRGKAKVQNVRQPANTTVL